MAILQDLFKPKDQLEHFLVVQKQIYFETFCCSLVIVANVKVHGDSDKHKEQTKTIRTTKLFCFYTKVTLESRLSKGPEQTANGTETTNCKLETETKTELSKVMQFL